MQMYFKRGKTIIDLLVTPKDRDTIFQNCGVIYSYKCERVDVEEEYIGEFGITFDERFQEHLKVPLTYL